MSAILHLLSPGALASIQDGGRVGWRHLGIPRAGALDPELLQLANTLVGNALLAPAIECFDGGLRLRAEEGPLRVAVAGHGRLVNGEGRTLACNRSHTLSVGEELRVVAVEDGRVLMLAVFGLQLTPVLGACATYARAGLGGIDGRWLAAGTRIPLYAAADGSERHLPAPLPRRDATLPVRLVPGPQADHFTAAAMDTLFSSEYTVSSEADRMGMRLIGSPLAHNPAHGSEIISDATVPGAIQVPGNGQPIVLLADGQTAGGYPKVATVISADLPWLATRRAGTPVRFQCIDVDQAEQLAREAAQTLRQRLDSVTPLLGLDEALNSLNLISGMVSTRADPDETLEWMPRT